MFISKTVVPQLIVKPILHPFEDKKRKKVNKKDIERLKEWSLVWDSVWSSIRGSVGYSVGNSVWNSVWSSVRDSVRYSVGYSVGNSVCAYISSFFELDDWKGENPFQSGIDLRESGLVPSFDGKTWKLHGHKGNVLFEATVEELKDDY